VTDPSLAPPEGEAFYVLSPVPHLGKAKIDWSVKVHGTLKDLGHAGKKTFAGFKKYLVTTRIFTPADFNPN